MTATPGSSPTRATITSVPNTVAAIDGNNAQVRVIIDGSQTGGSTGFVLDARIASSAGWPSRGSASAISIPDPTDVGDLIQGNFIGPYLAYPVDQSTGDPLPAPDTVILAGEGNTQEGIMLGSANATVGGFNPDENNVISGNGAQGVLLLPGTSGNQVLGNQIGVDRAVHERALFPGRQRRRRGVDRVVRDRGRSVEHRLFVEQRDRRRRPGLGQRDLGQRWLWRSFERCRGHAKSGRGQLHRRALPAAATSSEPAIPETRPTACGSTTPLTIRSAALSRPTAT